MNKAAIRKIFPGIIFALSILCNAPALSAEQPASGKSQLLERYGRIEKELVASAFDAPIFLESFEKKSALRGDVYGVIEHPFDVTAEKLREPADWCDIASLHLNIKACTYTHNEKDDLLTFFSGSKYYQPPEDTRRLTYEFSITDRQAEYIEISLTTDEGPLNTRDYRIILEVMPLDGGRSLIHLSYSYHMGFTARLAMKGYLATVGADKVGFTVTRRDREGNPVYVKGARGIVERNAARFYFAIQAYMDTLKFPEEERFDKRISYWYALTDKHRRQLFELEEKDYIDFKKKERVNQLRLQAKIEADWNKNRAEIEDRTTDDERRMAAGRPDADRSGGG